VRLSPRRSGRSTQHAPSSVLGERPQGLVLSSARHRVPPVSLNLSHRTVRRPWCGSLSREAASVLTPGGSVPSSRPKGDSKSERRSRVRSSNVLNSMYNCRITGPSPFLLGKSFPELPVRSSTARGLPKRFPNFGPRVLAPEPARVSLSIVPATVSTRSRIPADEARSGSLGAFDPSRPRECGRGAVTWARKGA